MDGFIFLYFLIRYIVLFFPFNTAYIVMFKSSTVQISYIMMKFRRTVFTSIGSQQVTFLCDVYSQSGFIGLFCFLFEQLWRTELFWWKYFWAVRRWQVTNNLPYQMDSIFNMLITSRNLVVPFVLKMISLVDKRDHKRKFLSRKTLLLKWCILCCRTSHRSSVYLLEMP